MTLSSATLILSKSNLEKVSLVSGWWCAVVEKMSNRLSLRHKLKPNWCWTTLFFLNDHCIFSWDVLWFFQTEFLSNYGYPSVFGACRTATKSCIDNECSFVSQSQQSAAVSARSSTERQQQSQQQLALSKVQQSWAEGEFPATIMSELPSGKSGGIGRERTLNGESTHQTPLPIHLAIESEDHSTDKKNAPWTQFKSLRIPGYYGRSLRWIYLV